MTAEHPSRAIDQTAFREVMSRFASGVTVVVTVADGDAHGMTASAFCSVSLDPPLVLVCIDHAAKMHGFLESARTFAITVLGEDQGPLSSHFANPDRVIAGEKQFDGVAWWSGPELGLPVLAGGLAYLECEVDAMHPAGDHTIVVGAVVGADILDDARPLVYFRSRYRRLDPAD